MKSSILALLGGACLSAILPVAVVAQEADFFARDRNTAVSERARPELEALGLRLGSFMAYPKAQFDFGYDSNVLITEFDEESDTLVRFSPRVDLESDWARHSLDVYARATLNRYSKFNEENSETWALGANGRLDVQRRTRVNGGWEYASEMEPRSYSGSPESIAEPIRFEVIKAHTVISHTLNRVRLNGRLDVRQQDYDDGRSFSGTVIEQDDRDQTSYEASARIDYALSPATAVFGRLVVNDRQFDSAGSPGTPRRDSSGYNATVGGNFELTDLMRGEVGAGYLRQEFDEAVYGEFSGLSANARLEYFVTPLLTLGLSADRSVSDSGVVGTASFLATTVQATADYELRRNVLLGARVGRALEELDGIDRENERWFGGVRASYLMNRRIGVTASYDFETRDSRGTRAVNDFTAHRVLISLVAQY